MIILIHGPPAAGKSSLASELSVQLRLPHLSCDNIREWMFDLAEPQQQDEHEATPSPELQRYLPGAAYDLMFSFAAELAKGDASFIVEGCINVDHGGRRLLDLCRAAREKIGAPPHKIAEVFVSAPNELLVQRYSKRANTPNRHSAHGDESKKVERLKEHLEVCHYRLFNVFDWQLTLDSRNSFAENFTQLTDFVTQCQQSQWDSELR